MPIVHIEQLDGDDAYKHLPRAHAELRAWNWFYEAGSVRTKTIPIDGGYIRVRQVGEIQYIAINSAGGLYFEFATSGAPIVLADFTQEGYVGQQYSACIVGTTVSARDGAITLSPGIRGGRRALSGGESTSRVGRQYQTDLVHEPVAYPFQVETNARTRYPTALYESWAPGNPHTGVPLRNTLMQRAYGGGSAYAGPIEQYRVRDVGFDVAFEKGEGLRQVQRAYLRGNRDWPRASGLQTVTSELHGTRLFAVYIDASSRVSVFPVSAINAQDGAQQNVDDSDLLSVVPNLPGWAYIPTAPIKDYSAPGSDYVDFGPIDFPELDWKFNHLGTKAVSIVYARAPYEFDSAFFATPGADGAFTQAYFDEIVASAGVQTRAGQTNQVSEGYQPNVYFTAPMVVELGINITITGANARDFSLEVTVREVREPATATRCAVLVGYVWYDNDYAAAGDLVCLDVERYAAFFFVSIVSRYDALSLRNLNTGAELKCLRPEPIVAADLKTLSFVLQTAPIGGFGSTTPAGAVYDRFGLSIYCAGNLQEILFPQSEYPAGVQDAIRTAAEFDMRSAIDEDIDNGWQYVPMLPVDGDGWDDPMMLVRRAHLADGGSHFAFITGATSTERFWTNFGDRYIDASGIVETFDDFVAADAEVLFNASNHGYDNQHLIFCTYPKWGWHCYQGAVANVMHLCAGTTFFTHPSGSYALWNNSYIYSANGVGSKHLDTYDASLVEHVIFDRIHLVVRKKRTNEAGERIADEVHSTNTTFFELYNRAVGEGISAAVGFEALQSMAAADLRATFSKDVAEDTIFPGTQYLKLRAEWNGLAVWFEDSSVHNRPGPDSGPYNNTGRSSAGSTFSHFWQTDAGLVTPTQDARHVRFANPVILES